MNDSLSVLAPGAVFARDFRVVRRFAEGGMGAVYEVEQLSTGKHRALKVMHSRIAADARSRERFVQEARVGARIASDHVIEIVAAGVDDVSGTPWLAMELLEGEDLGALAERRGPLPPAEVREIFRQLGHALAAAHAAGIIHRDLKPENLFISVPRRSDTPFTLKVLDFGIAKVLAEHRTAATATAAVGSPAWMAPEQADLDGRLRPATDVWPLGLIAFYLLTGKHYWLAANAEVVTATALLTEILVRPLESASARAASYGVDALLPPGFDAWFARCVVREPDARFHDAGEAVAPLLPILSGMSSAPPEAMTPRASAATPGYAPTQAVWTPTPASSSAVALASTDAAPVAPLASPPPPRSRAPLIAVGIAASLLASAALGSVLYLRTRAAPAPSVSTAPPVSDHRLAEYETLYAQPLRVRAGVALTAFARRYEADHDDLPTAAVTSGVLSDLRAYLVLTAPRAPEEPSPADVGHGAFITERLEELGPPPDLPATEAYLQALGRRPDLAGARDASLVSRVRAALASAYTAVPEVGSLVEGARRLNVEVTSASVFGASFASIPRGGVVRGAFTRAGWERLVRDRIFERPGPPSALAWVAGADYGARSASVAAAFGALRVSYFAAYVQEWRAFLESLRVAEPADVSAAAAMLSELRSGESPAYVRLVRVVAENTQHGFGQAAGAHPGVIDALRARLTARVDAAVRVEPALADGAPPRDAGDVREAFRGFVSADRRAAGQPASMLEQYLAQLATLHEVVLGMAQRPHRLSPAETEALNTARLRVTMLLSVQEPRWQPRFTALCSPPVDFAVQQTLAAQRDAGAAGVAPR